MVCFLKWNCIFRFENVFSHFFKITILQIVFFYRKIAKYANLRRKRKVINKKHYRVFYVKNSKYEKQGHSEIIWTMSLFIWEAVGNQNIWTNITPSPQKSNGIIGLEAYDNGCGELKKYLSFEWTFFRITHQILSRFFPL
jgi:hypothetical protein